jgi:glycosyltransferase involved in cell wall biosynthesis
MRILLAAHAYPPRSVAGVEVYTHRLARALQARGHEVLVLAAAHDLSAAPYAVRRRNHDGVAVAEVVNLHQKGTLEATWSDPDLERAVLPVIAQFRPDCVHAQHLLNLSVGLLAACHGLGAGVVLTVHDYWLSCPRDGLRMRADLVRCDIVDHATCARCLAGSPYLVPALERRAVAAARWAGLGGALHRIHRVAPVLGVSLRRLARLGAAPQSLAQAMDRRAASLRAALAEFDLVLAPTAFARDRAIEFGVAPDRVRVSALGVPAGVPDHRPPAPRRRLGFMGTVAPHKGVHVLVEAFRRVDAPEARLEIHGSLSVAPDYVARLRVLTDADARIALRGPFAEGTQAEVLAGLDVLVMPSVWWENSPLTVLEALAAGVPVVASAIGGIPDILPPEWGRLVPAGEVPPLAEALRDVIEGRVFATLPPRPRTRTIDEEARELESLYAGLQRSVALS